MSTVPLNNNELLKVSIKISDVIRGLVITVLGADTTNVLPYNTDPLLSVTSIGSPTNVRLTELVKYDFVVALYSTLIKLEIILTSTAIKVRSGELVNDEILVETVIPVPLT